MLNPGGGGNARCCILKLRRLTSPTTIPSPMDWLSDAIQPFKVKKMCITIYQPQNNGIVERCYRTLLDMLHTIEQEQEAQGYIYVYDDAKRGLNKLVYIVSCTAYRSVPNCTVTFV